MNITKNIEGETVVMMVVAQNLRVRRIVHTSNYHRKQKKRECDKNNKTDLQVHNVFHKNNLQDTEVSTEIIFIINSNSM